jgi:hypothetical protein
MPLLQNLEPRDLLLCPEDAMVRKLRQTASGASADQNLASFALLPASAAIPLLSLLSVMGWARIDH